MLGCVKDFLLNGFLNLYPDFLLVTKSGKTSLLETKGGGRENSDPEANPAGQKVVPLVGLAFLYLMVFEQWSSDGPSRWPLRRQRRQSLRF